MSSFITTALDKAARTSDAFADRLRPVPKAGAQGADVDDADVAHGVAAKVIAGFRAQIQRGNPISMDAGALASIVDALRHNNAIDDRKLLLEHVLTLLSKLPPESAVAKTLNTAVVTMLYYDLSHPPATYIDRPVMRAHYDHPASMRSALTSAGAHGAGTSGDPAAPPKANGNAKANGHADPHHGLGTRGQGHGALAEGPPLPPPTYAWRLPDGSYNSLSNPEMGRAGSHYTRTIQGKHPVSELDRPDPSLVFDALLRREKFVEHPAGLSSLMFGFAALVIHTIFYTNHADPTINLTNSYVDLSPLYGFSDEAQDAVRRKYHTEDRYAHDDTGYSSPAYAHRPLGRGLLHEDSFAEDRFLLLPPSSAVFLVLFCRNHNYIAAKLLEINERGVWTDPLRFPPPPGAGKQAAGPEKVGKAAGAATHVEDARGAAGPFSAKEMSEEQICERLLKQDDEIFNTAKLINVAWFAMAVFSDYFSTILGLVRNGSSWTLDPFNEIRSEDRSFVGRGEGNSCSVEFNHVYHWHAIVSQADEHWTEGVFTKIFGAGKKFDEITPAEFIGGVRAMKENEDPDMSTWTIGQMKRGPDGRFADDDLARVLQDAADQPAAAFGARGTPAVLKIVDVLGILQSRRWGVCTLNEFREYFGLRRYTSFEEWNPDKDVAEAAYRLYGHIDNLELYVGLQAEEVKPVVDGAGLCPGYTMSRAILGDAIALTRGDRFFTTDFTPWNLTPWGYADCARDPSNAGFGSQLGRLLLRTLPNNFTHDSTYTWFPLMTPKAMKGILTNLELADKYDFSRPAAKPAVVSVEKYDAVQRVMANEDFAFASPYGKAARKLVSGPGFFVSFDDPAKHQRDQRTIMDALLANGGIARAAAWYGAKTQELLKERSYKLPTGTYVDIVRDVLNVVPIHWVASEVAGLSLKTKDHARGVYFESEMQQMLREVYAYIFLESDTATKMALEDAARRHAQGIVRKVRQNLAGISGSSWSLVNLFSSLFGDSVGPTAKAFLQRLYEKGKGDEELANNVFAVVVGASVEYAQGLVHVVNFYLDEKNAAHRKRICELALSESEDANAGLEGYVREALRLDPPMPGPLRDVKAAFEAGDAKVQAGGRVFVNFAAANLNETVFPQPTEVLPTRPKDAYAYLGDGVHQILGNDFVHTTMARVLKTVFSLKNLRRAPGQQGILKRLPRDVYGQTHYEYLDHHQKLVPWATSMVLQYDE
ncbi:putative linoleate diol synthase [Auricularia subglabra TFB-10046 SS5]|nr:putative linoleate diol synthase [Auricularia subglabra TFB-10046 SS5]